MSNGDAMDVAISTLAAFIKNGISELTVKTEWPYANEKLNYPSLTIMSGNPKRTPYSYAQFVSQTDPDPDNKIVVQEVVAEWDDTVQMDLWARDKNERRIITDKITALFNSQQDGEGVDGLSLVMDGNFGQICRYTIDTVKPVDDEAGAQRQERRELFKILVNCDEVRERTYYAMVKIQTYTQATPDTLSDDDIGTEINLV